MMASCVARADGYNPAMRLLGLDLGSKRIGVALSDGSVDAAEEKALGKIAELVGIPMAAVSLLIEEVVGKRR